MYLQSDDTKQGEKNKFVADPINRRRAIFAGNQGQERRNAIIHIRKGEDIGILQEGGQGRMKTYKFRLYPSAEQETKLDEQIEMCRQLYNGLLEQRITAHKMGKKIGYVKQANEIPELKRTFEEYKNIHSQVLQDVAKRVDRTYRNFFRRVREKKSGKQLKAGFPRFKSKTRYRSITYPQSGFVILDNGHLKLSKIGELRMFMHRSICGEIKTLNVSMKETGKWYASFSVMPEKVATALESTGQSIGIDAGLMNLVTMSDGTTIPHPRFLKKGEKKIKREQRRLSRKVNGSENRNKQRMRVARAYGKVKDQREDFAHKLAHELVKNNDFIVFEDLKINRMVKNHYLAKNIADASWNTLVQYTTYKAESAGKEVVLVDPRNTSKTCSRCGHRKEELKLSTRVFRCGSCGYEIDRDLNAAINIHNRALEKVGRGTSEFTPVEIGALPARATPVGESGSPTRLGGEDVTFCSSRPS